MNKSPSLDLEERAPRQLSFPCGQFLAADQQGVQTHNSRSKHQVNLLGYSFRQGAEVFISNYGFFVSPHPVHVSTANH